MDSIFIHDLTLPTRIGIYAWEREVAQPVRINVELALPSDRPCHSDDFNDALDYSAVVRRIGELLADHPYHLVERLAQAIADIVLNEFGTPWVRVSLAKISALPGLKELGVTLERGVKPV